jgi:hypothetical protein
MSSQITIQRQNAQGSSYTTGAITVSLTTTSTGGAFYATSTSTTPETSVSIASGQSSASFYYKDSTAGTPTLTISSTGYASGTTTFTITGPPSKLVFTAGTSQSLNINTVSSVITVQLQDAGNNPVTSGSAITVSLTATGTTTGVFCSNAAGTTVITSVTINAGSSSASFYYKDSNPGTPTITASANGLTSATTTFIIILNDVSNSGFESPTGGWSTSGTGYAAIQADDNINHSGNNAAEEDLQVTGSYGSGVVVAALKQTFSPAISISSIPNTSGALSIWIYNNGYGKDASTTKGYYSFEIILTASDGSQLIYYWGDSPATAPTSNSTAKVINMGTIEGTFTVGQWVQFSVNLQQDWINSGLSSSATIASLTIQSNGIYQSNNPQYGQEIYIDDVVLQ